MNTRRAYVDLIYNGTAATAEISGFVTDISYTDPASGEADSLDITLQDRDRRWTGAWIPVAGDTLAATIDVYKRQVLYTPCLYAMLFYLLFSV